MSGELGTIEDRQFNSFTLDANGKVCRRICGDIGVSQNGLSIGGLITEVTLSTATWTALPPTPLANRNAMGFQNSTNETISVNFSTPAGIVGWKVKPNGELFFDVTDAVIVYAKALTGSPMVTVMEIA